MTNALQCPSNDEVEDKAARLLSFPSLLEGHCRAFVISAGGASGIPQRVCEAFMPRPASHNILQRLNAKGISPSPASDASHRMRPLHPARRGRGLASALSMSFAESSARSTSPPPCGGEVAADSRFESRCGG